MLWIAIRTLRDRWTLFAGSFVALALGTALMTTNGLTIVAAASYRPIGDGPGRYAAVPVVVHADQNLRLLAGPNGDEWTGPAPEQRRVPTALVDRIRTVPGVSDVVADRWLAVAVLDDAGQPVDVGLPFIGHGWSSARFGGHRLAEGQPPAAGEVVLTTATAQARGVGLGATVNLLTPAGVTPARVSGLARSDGPTGDAEPVFLSDADASATSLAPDQVDVIAVYGDGAADALADRVRQALPDPRPVVETGQQAPEGGAADPFRQAREDLVALLATTAVIAGFVSIFVVASTFAFTVAQRRREIALLRLIGAAGRNVRRMVSLESLLVGVIGSAAGCLVGILGAALLARQLVANGLAPPGFTTAPVGWLMLATFGIGVVVSFLGVAAASRRAAKVRPIEALREATVDSRVMTGGRWFFGLLLLAGAAVLLVVLPAAGTEAAVPISIVVTQLLVVALTALGPLFLPRLVWLTSLPLSTLSPASGMLARQNAVTGVRRTVSTAAPVMLTAAIALSTLGVGATITASVIADNRDRVKAQLVAAPTDGPGIPTTTIDQISRAPGVTAVTAVVATEAYAVSGSSVWATTAGGVDLGGLAGTHDLRLDAGSLDNLGANSAVLTREGAELVEWSAGETHTVYFGDGASAEVVVAAVVTSGGGLPGLMLPRGLVIPHVHDPMADAVYVTLADPANGDGGGGASAVRDLVRRSGGTTVSTEQWLAEQADAAEQANRVVFTLLIGMALVYSAIAVANTLLMSAGQRVREVTLLRAVGGTGRQVLTMFLWESIAVVVVGLALGTVVASASILGVYGVLRRTIDEATIALPWSELSLVFGVSAAVGIVSALIPAWRALHRQSLATIVNRE